jgi:hypothetical protein
MRSSACNLRDSSSSFGPARRTFWACVERRGSVFHQSIPISCALSSEQTSSRIWMVSSSTSASWIRMSPAIMSPLSSIRSSTSTSPWDRCGPKSYRSAKWSRIPVRFRADGPGAEIDVQVVLLEAEDLAYVVQPFFQAHEGQAEPLHLVS